MNPSHSDVRLKNVLEKCGYWMATSEGKVSWAEIMPQHWEISFDESFGSFSMGECSGLIAYAKNPMSVTKTTQTIKVYDHSSTLLSAIIVENKCFRVFVYVFKNDNIGCITDDGFLYIYSHNIVIKKINFFNQKKMDTSLLSYCFWEEGIVILSSDMTLYESVHFEKPQILTKLDEIESEVSSLKIVPHKNSPTNGTIAFVLLKNGSVVVASSNGSYKVDFQSPVVSAEIASDYSKIAFLHENGCVVVTDILMSNVIYETQIDFSIFGEYQMMKWCGNVAPVVLFENGLMLACSDDSNPCWSFDGKCIGFTELDSLYILTQTKSYRLVEVPESVSNVLSSLVLSDGSKICKIYDEREEEPIHQHIDEVDFEKASDECLNAATFINDEEGQMFFLSAAQLCGRNNELERTVRNVRILNTLRTKASMPITYQQLLRLDTDGVIKRLCYRRMHDVAASIARETKSPLENIGEDFVEYVVTNLVDDKECLSELLTHDYVNFSYATMFAIRKGRTDLATSLIDNEKNLGRRSYYLGKLGKWEQAFEAVSLSCDMSALFTLVIMAIGEKDTVAVNKAIASSESACYFTLRFPCIIGEDRIKAILELVDRTKDIGNVVNVYLSFQRSFSLPGCDNLQKLRNVQEVISKDIRNQEIVGLSFNATIRKLAHLGLKHTAKLFAKECKIKDSRLAVVYIQGLIDAEKYIELFKFAAKKKRKDVWELTLELLYNKGHPEKARELCVKFGSIDHKRAQKLLSSIDGRYIGPKSLSERGTLFRIFSDNTLF